MNRRELLKSIALVTGGVVIGGDIFLTGCKVGPKEEAGFTPGNIALLDEIGETIIPATTTPGAKAAKIGQFMQVIVTDCYTQKQQDAFMKGISEINVACDKMHGKSFMDCNEAERKDLLLSLEKEAKEFNQKRDEHDAPLKEAHMKEQNTPPFNGVKEFDASPSHYYTMMKQLTLWGFFTSETGMTETLRHVAVPGKYDGAVPYTKGEKAWAE
ncbi:MAG TPA: gluconate 2-dehydrogenase subunit 3 family protein [Cyclobacteriaceae bacterium]|nr:gluconate 2-dehydrogenase subunit 3 family protein [Cyclobacteriaceae bacterium]